jgi:hypothetical protein
MTWNNLESYSKCLKLSVFFTSSSENLVQIRFFTENPIQLGTSPYVSIFYGFIESRNEKYLETLDSFIVTNFPCVGSRAWHAPARIGVK